jgi:phosphate transport system substrate-binding protein
MRTFFYLLIILGLVSCKQKTRPEAVKETRTSGTLTMLVDESVGPIVQKQIDIFSLDYPQAKFQTIVKPEEKIITAFLNDSVRVIVLPRMLNKQEEKYYNQRNIKINTSRFAIDGIALITNKDNIDSTITVKEVIDVLQGRNSDKKLVFDNAYSSTFHYFKQLARISQFPAKNVYSKQSSN